MAELETIDKIAEEIKKIRGVDLPLVCIKIIILSYIMYCANTYDVKYKNEDGQTMRLNSGCIVLCQKGSGKSRTLKALKKIFIGIENERVDRYEKTKEVKIGRMLNSLIPITAEQKKEIEKFYDLCGHEPVSVFDDPITSKGLCETYAQCKGYKVNNLLFTVDEAGDRLFRDAFSKDPSISAREFVQAINQLFDGYCGMGKSKTSKTEGITSQYDVGANFIFVSTAEFLKDYHVQQRYQSSFEGGIARRLLYVNCPPIDKLHTNRKRYFPDFEQFVPIADEIFTQEIRHKEIKVSEELWGILEQEGAGCGVTIDDEFLLLLFCCVLAIWTGDGEILPKHWKYMVGTFKEMKNVSLAVVQKDTTNYDKICVFMREWLEKNSNEKRVPMALIKDYCLRSRMCFENQYKKWFNNLCSDFADTKESKYIIERNQRYAWLEENFAYAG